jgi:hypothetical protein
MGTQEYDTFSELGIRTVYRYFLLGFSITLSMLILSLMLYFNQEKIWEVTPFKIYFVLTVFFLFLIIFIYFIKGIATIFNARKEFESNHEINVVMASLLFIAFFIIFFINLSLARGFTGGTSLIAYASMGFDSSLLILIITVVVFSVLVYLLLGYASLYLIKGMIEPSKTRILKKGIILFALSTFTLNITGLIAFVLFYTVYRDAYSSLNVGSLKAKKTAPCPYCDREIPIDSQACPYCDIELKSKQEEPQTKRNPSQPEEEFYPPLDSNEIKPD